MTTAAEAKTSTDAALSDIVNAIAAGPSEAKILALIECKKHFELVATQLANQKLEERNAAIADLINKINNGKTALEAAHDQQQSLTKALTSMSRAVEALGKLIGQLPK